MQKPPHLHPWADEILEALSAHPEAAEIVLGGYFALQHYLDYRRTNDVDAWWRTWFHQPAAGEIRKVLQAFAARHSCELRERQFGETLSFEIVQGGKKQFSFQIAVRSRELEPPVPSAWPPILIETIRDNVGAKMNALVDRGAPRDFLDIRHVVEGGLATGDECWNLWMHKNDVASKDAAKQKVLAHLAALEMRRPLESISDASERKRARETRDWFKNDFLRS